MRNLKRALSLALASVMLLGMMVVGTSAAFADADEIVNTEAVEITAGLGLFAGSDGKFNPTGTVTRAQMATVIVKMLYGSEINADAYKGAAKFSDVASFEGGWAEGYINLCASLGIVAGYGDGTFKPGQALTTAEAVTMLLNALDVDAGEGTWPLTVMAAAEKIKLYESMASAKPTTNEALTRDQLSVLVLNALNYSPEGTKGYMVGDIMFTDYLEALLVAMTKGEEVTVIVGDSLATKVFDLKSVEGFIVANQASGDAYTTVGTVDLALETGVDMLGHYVTAYYAEEWQSESNPGVAYCIIDEAEYVVVADDIDGDKKAYKDAFGSKAVAQIIDSDENVVVALFDDEYNLTGTGAISGYDVSDMSAPEAVDGTYVIYEGKIVGYMDEINSSAVVVDKIVTKEGQEAITLSGESLDNTAEGDEVIEYAGIAEGDVAIATVVKTVTYLDKADVVSGKITKTYTDGDGLNHVVFGGTDYVVGPWTASDAGLSGTYTNFSNTYNAYVYNGQLIGIATPDEDTSVDISGVIYVLGTYEIKETDAYGKNTGKVYAQGVDMEGKEVSILVDVIAYDEDWENGEGTVASFSITPGFNTFKLSTVSAEKALNIMTDTLLLAKGAEGADDLYTADTAAAQEFKTSTSYIEIDGDFAYLTADTKFIFVKGAAGAKLTTSVSSGAVAHKLGAEVVAPVILAKDEKGIETLKVVVIAGEPEKAAPTQNVIYVSDAQVASAAKVGTTKFEVEVYFAATNEYKVITINEANFAEMGDNFYSVTESNGVYSVAKTEGEFTVVNTAEMDEEFGYVFSGMLVSSDIANLKVADVKVIDTRSAAELKASEIAKIEDLADVEKLAEKYTITFDALLDKASSATKVTHIFVTGMEEIPEET